MLMSETLMRLPQQQPTTTTAITDRSWMDLGITGAATTPPTTPVLTN